MSAPKVGLVPANIYSAFPPEASERENPLPTMLANHFHLDDLEVKRRP
jgi:hypothetical protein